MSVLTTAPPASRPPGAWRRPLSYLLFTVLPAITAFLLVRPTSGGGGAGRPPGPSTPVPPVDVILPGVLLGIAVVVVVSQLVGALAVRLRQPRVFGEIIAGILLGPTVLGAVSPGVSLFTPSMMPLVDALAQLGVLFFMFRVGRELPMSLLRGHGTTAVVVGHAGIAVPFLAGVLLALGPLAALRPAGASVTAFVMMSGIALSVTAFPVLARILEERSLRDTRIGALGMAVAGITDVSAWCLLALVMATVRGTSPGGVVRTVLLTAVFAALMWWVVRPLLQRLTPVLAGRARGSAAIVVVLLLLVLLCAAITDAIGISPIFGAFIAGLVVPRGEPWGECAVRLDGSANWLLPLFFADVGFKTDLWSLQLGAGWLTVLAVVATATAGKLLGVVLPARMAGLDTRSAFAVGSMMNCRGLTEIIVLQLGLSAGVISQPLFTVLLVMTLVTTAMTGPLLGMVLPGRTADTLLPGHR